MSKQVHVQVRGGGGGNVNLSGKTVIVGLGGVGPYMGSDGAKTIGSYLSTQGGKGAYVVRY